MALTDDLQAADTRQRIDELLAHLPTISTHHAIGGRPYIAVRIETPEVDCDFHQYPAVDPDEPIPYGTHVHRDIPVDTVRVAPHGELSYQ